MEVKIKKVRPMGKLIAITVTHPDSKNEAELIFTLPLPGYIANEIFTSTSKEDMDKLRGAK